MQTGNFNLVKQNSVMRISVMAAMCLTVFLAGCKGPTDAYQSAKDKVQSAEENIQAAELSATKHGVGNALAAQAALSGKPNKGIHEQVAEGRLKVARAAFEVGRVMPPAETILELEQAAANAVSTNAEMASAADVVFAAYDKELTARDEAIQRLQGRLEAAEKKADNVNQRNAADAEFKRSIVKLGWYLFFGVVGLVAWNVLKVVGVFNPVVGAGVGAFRVAGNTLASALRQVKQGGDSFIQSVQAKAELSDDQKKLILDLFKEKQNSAQDEKVRQLVRKISKA